MTYPKPLLFGVALLVSLTATLPAQPFVFLGDAPAPPTDLSGLPRRLRQRDVTGGFSVNTASREEVRGFYNAVFTASADVPMNSSAVVASCTPGTNATAYTQAVLRRINWFRALAGVPADVAFDAAASLKCQQAAVMMAANSALSHSPPPSWTCYTAAGAEAAGKSNLAGGNTGPDAITGYIWDPAANNVVVGHRRWLLYPQTQIMGTGDVPAQGTQWAANATWMFDANYGGPRPGTRDGFVSWPPPGFVPYQVVFARWSFAYPNADFSAATVAMRSNNMPVAVSMQSVANGYGENTLVWIPAGQDANGLSRWTQPAADTVYSVTINNVAGASASQFSYSVTVFDPAVPGADYHPPVISGPSQPAVGQGNLYTFTTVTNATSYQWLAARRLPYSLTDGAENGLTNFVVTISPGYTATQSTVKATGNRAFHLAHTNGTTDQTLLLNRTLFPGSNGVVNFKSELGYATTGQVAKVQVSTDDGSTWQDIYSQAGIGGLTESSFNNRSASLASVAGRNTRLRFNYHYESGSFYNQSSAHVGWYLDDLVVTNCEELVSATTNNTAAASFLFHPALATNYNLNVRALIFGEFPLAWGPARQVTAITSAPPIIITLSRPTLAGAQVQVNFLLASGSAPSFKLLQADVVTGPWTTNSAAVLTTNAPGSYRFTAATGGADRRFYRVKTP
jgi:hypothetical protein